MKRRLFALLFATSLATALAGASPARAAGRDSWYTPDALAGAPSEVENDVQRAHSSFLEGDLTRMMTSIKRGLMAHPGDPDVQANLLSLLDQAYQNGRGSVPADWHLPDGITRLRLGVKRKYDPNRDRVRYNMHLYGRLKTPDTVEQLQLIRYPNEVVMDKKQGIGSWSDVSLDKEPSFYLGSDDRATPPQEGLYLLNVQLKGGEAVQGWVVLSRTVSSDSPAVLSPTFHENVPTATPTFRWKEFKSPEYRSFEDRRMLAMVFSEKDEYNEPVWEYWTARPETQQVTLGGGPDTAGTPTLGKGAYLLSVGYHEQWFFGDLQLSRESVTKVPFQIAE